MSKLGIDDPLRAVGVCHRLYSELHAAGFDLQVTSDLERFASERLSARGQVVSPFFDPLISGLNIDRFYWMKLSSPPLKIAALQAYRLDFVDVSLSDWFPSYHIGLYVRRNEIWLPSHVLPPSNSISHRLRGRLVYHGEVWVNPQVRSRMILEKFSRLGMILAQLKWNPEAVWGLSSKTMAMHGHPSRMGYAYMESGFLRWQWADDKKPYEDWLNVSERYAVEQMIQDMSLSFDEALDRADDSLIRDEYQLAQSP